MLHGDELDSKIQEIMQFINDSLCLMTKSSQHRVSHATATLINKETEAMVISHVFEVYLTENQKEFLTRDEGSALSALAHMISVILQNENLPGSLQFSGKPK